MLSCPFLKRVTSSMIQSEPINLLSSAIYCPVMRKLGFAIRQKSTIPIEVSSVSGKTNEYSIPTEDKSAAHSSDAELVENAASKCPFLKAKSSFVGQDADIVENAFNIAARSELRNHAAITPNQCPYSKMVARDAQLTTTNQYNCTRTKEQFDESGQCCQLDMSTEKVSKVDNTGSKTAFDYKTFFQHEIDKKKHDNSYRVFKRVLRCADRFPMAEEHSFDPRRVAVWCSNDYMGMSWHPRVQEAAISAIRKHGVGSGGTRNISGNTLLHEELESELADLHKKESALLFTSCYVANEATLYTLGQRLPDVQIFSDAGNHASMIHGIRTSRAPKHIFRHNDTSHLEQLLLEKGKSGSPKVVAFETVHSMTGDVCPLDEFLTLTEKYDGLSFVDEVHAVGLYGEEGAGVAQRDGHMHRIDAITGTLGKAFANVGGYLAGSRELVDMIRSYAAGFIFTTSLPPPVLAAARAAVQVLRSEEGKQLRQLHQARVHDTRESLRAEGLPVIDCPSHIIPVHVGDPGLCLHVSNELLRNHNIYVQSINYPTVAKGEERLRIAPSPHHSSDLLKDLVGALKTVWLECDLPLLPQEKRVKPLQLLRPANVNGAPTISVVA